MNMYENKKVVFMNLLDEVSTIEKINNAHHIFKDALNKVQEVLGVSIDMKNYRILLDNKITSENIDKIVEACCENYCKNLGIECEFDFELFEIRYTI